MIGVEGGALEENGCCGIEKRPIGDVGVASDPANVSSTPVDVALLLWGREGEILVIRLMSDDNSCFVGSERFKSDMIFLIKWTVLRAGLGF
jgi:hypothetical protein